jgi:hypothetical protein
MGVVPSLLRRRPMHEAYSYPHWQDVMKPSLSSMPHGNLICPYANTIDRHFISQQRIDIAFKGMFYVLRRQFKNVYGMLTRLENHPVGIFLMATRIAQKHHYNTARHGTSQWVTCFLAGSGDWFTVGYS